MAEMKPENRIEHCTLGPDVIHVWPVHLDSAEEIVTAFDQFLSLDEATRADRFRYAHLRKRYVLGRGALRLLIAHYLNTPAQRISFEYGKYGKPRIRDSHVQFNVSHSDSIALLAFSQVCELGIDVEKFRPISNAEGLAQRFFCPEEAADLRSVPVHERDNAFLTCWTRKEAYIKAVGDGLCLPLDSFRVTFRRGDLVCITLLANTEDVSETWELHDLGVPPHYAAALAYRGNQLRIEIGPMIEPAELLHALETGWTMPQNCL
jgi:4'-phosphopantetheinyl transferase